MRGTSISRRSTSRAPSTTSSNGYPHPEWTYLRKHAPVFWYARDNVDPFWAITKHADIVEIGKQPDKFLNAPRLAVFTNELEPPEENTVRHLLNMDPPDHGRYRNVAAKQFTPRVGVRARAARRAHHARGARRGGPRRALRLRAGRLGEDHDRRDRRDAGRPARRLESALQVDQRDDRARRIRSSSAAARRRRRSSARAWSCSPYFHEMAVKRRAQPTNDIVSVVANGSVSGKPLEPVELLSYYFLLVVAGNETTRNAMTGGLLAFIENPEEWRKLVRDPSLLDPAVEEIVRWTTPVIQFARTATQDYELRGKKIRAGESALPLLSVGESRRRRLRRARRASGSTAGRTSTSASAAASTCASARTSRASSCAAPSRSCASGCEHVELAGPPERVRSSFVGGIKRVPIRWRLAPA